MDFVFIGVNEEATDVIRLPAKAKGATAGNNELAAAKAAEAPPPTILAIPSNDVRSFFEIDSPIENVLVLDLLSE